MIMVLEFNIICCFSICFVTIDYTNTLLRFSRAALSALQEVYLCDLLSVFRGRRPIQFFKVHTEML